MSKPKFHLGINLGFAINRFPEPQVWVPLVRRELGLRWVQFVADLLNPSLPAPLLQEQAALIRRLADREGVVIHSTFTSAFTRVNHLMHPEPRQRRWWQEWFESFARLSARLGAVAMGSHFGIMSVHDWERPRARRERVEGAVAAWQQISRVGQQVGLQYLIYEPMSVPRENAWTREEAQELRARVNAGSALPMEFCLDLGHAPHPEQRDPYQWLAALGPHSPVLHLQQTERDHSRHWPFTADCNARGIIEPGRVLELLAAAGREEYFLFLEISHRERWPDDAQVVSDLQESVACWREAIRRGGGQEA